MGGYIPVTADARAEMLGAMGLSSADDLFADVPKDVKLTQLLSLPEGLSEMSVRASMGELAEKNKVYGTILRGAGAYDHYIPSIVRYVPAKESFLTAYTPYQAEISQGVLQSIFEYQTMICELTGMDAANASHYDGASAAAEACQMVKERKRSRTLVSACAHPDVIATIKTYAWGADAQVIMIPEKDGVTDQAALAELLNEEVSGVYLQSPNFFGNIESVSEIAGLAHGADVKLILGTNPIAQALYRSAAELGADVAVGEGQPLGMPLSFGGPYLGFLAVKTPLLRKMPGRIVGETTDAKGERAFVLTLQAREQHIRREKAGSNICSNQALCALTAACYMSAMGPSGLREVAEQCRNKAHYFCDALNAIKGFKRVDSGPYFHEFRSSTPIPARQLEALLSENGILSGLPVGENQMLWCVTEKVTRESLDRVIAIVKGAVSCA